MKIEKQPTRYRKGLFGKIILQVQEEDYSHAWWEDAAANSEAVILAPANKYRINILGKVVLQTTKRIETKRNSVNGEVMTVVSTIIKDATILDLEQTERPK